MSTTIFKQGNKNMRFDIPSNQLTFLDNRFYITESGDYVPSVTTYLEAYPKSPQFFEWLKKVGDDADEIRDEAGRRGSIVHSLTERYDNGEEVSLLDDNGYIAYKLSEWAMLMKYCEFRNAHQSNVIYNELNLTSDKYKMGGTIDRVMTVNGKLYLLDIKTSNIIHPHYWLQLSAYQKLLLEAFPDLQLDGVAILWLNAKTRTDGKKGQVQGRGWQMCVCEDQSEIDTYWNRFKACQTLWLAENEDSKPKQLVYKINVKHNVETVK